jgi:phosphate-selective porin OprO/OprP
MDASVRNLTRIVVLILALAPSPSNASSNAVRLDFKKSPEVRFGDWLALELHGRVHTDVRAGSVKLERARLSVDGRFLKDWSIQLEGDAHPDDPEWLDAYVNYGRLREAEVRFGRFKMPFGLDRLTSSGRLDFVYRSRIGDVLSPGRDTGGLLHGTIAGPIASYHLGVFRADGEQSRNSTGNAAAARVTVSPLRILSPDTPPEKMELGAGIVHSKRAQGGTTYPAETINGTRFFSPVHASGNVRRLGGDWKWFAGPFSLRSEWIEMRQERRRESVHSTDLPDFLVRGWYASGTWLLTGEEKTASVKPRRNFGGGGFGALEIAARIERIGFRAATDGGVIYRSVRAENPGRAGNSITTIGLTWYLNRFVKIQWNAMRESVNSSFPAPPQLQSPVWSEVFRVQFEM